MKKLRLPENIDPQNELEFELWLTEQFINPIIAKGFNFMGYETTGTEEGTHCMHNLIFEETNAEPIPFNSVEYHELMRICEQDDDSQPPAMARLYFGSLFLTIPVCL